MWPVPCLLCTFTFPEASAVDRAAIAELIPNFNFAHRADSRRPWSELDGPYVSQRIQLLTPTLGIVRQALTWSTQSMTLEALEETAIFVIQKRGGAWRVIGAVARPPMR